ncbi:MAG: hypothetical protein JXA41_16180 [Deltaproteobacteria bacterium]|nr:hypothetical protein [Deltaproteobacteria bacterium]
MIGTRLEALEPELPDAQAFKLTGWSVRVLICWAISMGFSKAIETNGIQVIPFMSGDARQFMDAYLNGTLSTDTFHMPGYGMGRRRRFQGGNR